MSENGPQIATIFGEALEYTSSQEQAAYLDRACGQDAHVRARVEALLQAHHHAGAFLQGRARPLIDGEPEALAALVASGEDVGGKIDDYELLERIGEGGFGVVFRAQQQAPVRRQVALKVIRPGMDTQQVISRFEAERQALALMNHPNIAHVLDAGATRLGRPYFVMELVQGEPITDYCKQAKLPLEERLALFVAVCKAVQHAHQKGIIHRDLKPSNILVTQQDNTPVAKVIDFGIAKATSQQWSDAALSAQYAQIVGTPAYMSPEQAEPGSLDIDTRTDIYSLGVLLYELLTGTTPFLKERLGQVGYDEFRRIIREEEPPRPSARLRCQQNAEAIARLFELDWIVLKALEKDRNNRYESASALAADVEHYLRDEPVQASPPSMLYKLGKFARRRMTSLVMTGVLALALAVLGGSAAWVAHDRQTRRAILAQEVAQALEEAQRASDNDRLPAALTGLRRAEQLLSSGEAEPSVRRRVSQMRAELDLAARLEEIRLERGGLTESGFDLRSCAADYAGAFQAYGIAVMDTDSSEAAARVRQSPIRRFLLAALDDWAGLKTPERMRLLAIAQEADDDEFRHQCRDALLRSDKVTLRRLSTSSEVLQQSPSTLLLLAGALATENSSAAIELLRKAHPRHASDLWLNYQLGVLYQDMSPPLPKQAILYFQTALAIRPESPGILLNLGLALGHDGEELQEIAYLQRALEIKPDYAKAYSNMAGVYIKNGALQEGVAAAKKAIDFRPNYGNAYRQLAAGLARQGKLDEAILAYEEAFRTGLGESGTYHDFAVTLAKKGRIDDAVAAYRKAIDLKPDYALAHKNLGLTLSEAGRPAEAVVAFQDAIKHKPDYVEAYNGLGNALRECGRVEEALQAFRVCLRLKPDFTLGQGNLVAALLKNGRLNEAIAVYEEAVRFKPDVAENHRQLGVLLCDHKKDYDAAIACFREAIRLDPNHSSAHHDLSVALRAKGHVDEAITALKRTCELEPGNSKNHYVLGTWLFSRKRFGEAVEVLRKAVELKPDYAQAYAALGASLGQNGQSGQAVAAFRKAIELQPNDATSYYNLGRSLKEQGSLKEAIAAYEKAIGLRPDFATAYVSLARLLVTCSDAAFHDAPRAVKLAQRAAKLQPKTTGVWNTLGIAHYRAGEWQAAIDAMNKSREVRKGGDASELYFLAMAYWQLGNKDEALSWHKRAQQWMEKQGHSDDELKRLQTEATALLH